MLYGGNSFREKGSLLEDIRTVGCSRRRKFIAFCLCAILALIWFVPFSVELAGLGGHTSEASFEARIRKQERASFNRILGNIGPAAGAQDGLVVASKSQGEPDQPDYFYTWTRDSALTMKTLLHNSFPPSQRVPNHRGAALLEPLVRAYIASQGQLQQLDTRSGDLWSGGLNEPKFTVDGDAFNGDWGRPQRDGPALRALTLIRYAHFLLDRGNSLDCDYVRHNLYDPHQIRATGKVIKNDLEEVASGWWKESFDLWEEIPGHHLWGQLASLRALQAGAVLAVRLDDRHAADYYTRTAGRVEAGLSKFWTGDHWASSLTPVREAPMRDLDCGFTLSVLHFHHHNRTSFDPAEPGVLATLRLLARSFEGEYSLNTGGWTDGWLLGRYKGDEYDGTGKSKANPWFICSHAFAQVLYTAHSSFARSGVIQLSNLTVPFWTDVLGRNVTQTQWDSGSQNFDSALDALWAVAERYLEFALSHVVNGSMSEQIDRFTGAQRGARDLTWSHASFLDVAQARRQALTVRRRLEESSSWLAN